MNNTLLILGAGGHAQVVADCALAKRQWKSVAFLDDRYPVISRVNNWPVIGRVKELGVFVNEYPQMALGVGVGYEGLRLELLGLARKEGAILPAIIHPTATISPFATVGEGSVVFAGVVININARIGSGCIINTASVVEHDCIIGDGTHISPGGLLAGGVKTGMRVWVGIGASILQNLSVGADTIIGAGAVVVSDVPANSKALGLPAKIV